MVKKRVTAEVTGTDSRTRRWRMTFAAARMAYETGQYHQAESLLTRAGELAEAIPEKSFAVNATEIGRAAILLAQRRPAEAGRRLERTMSVLEGYTDSSHKELLAVALRFYAQTLADSGDERSAEKRMQASARMLEEIGADAFVQLAYTLSDLSGLYLLQGRLSEAEPLIMKAMHIIGTVLGPEAPEYTRADMIYQLS